MFLELENNSGKLQIVSGKFQNSGKLQNNAINNVKQISLSHVINDITIVIKNLINPCQFFNQNSE